MKKYLLTSLFSLLLFFPVHASSLIDDQQSLINSVNVLKTIVHNALTEQQAQSELNRLANTKPLVKDEHYIGHQLFINNQLAGLLKVSYQNNQPVLAAYSTVPLKVRQATKMYRAWREILSGQYKEGAHNYFMLGDGIVAQISKKQRGLIIFVSRNK